MSKDNRAVEKKLIDLFLNIKNTLENDPAIIDTIWFDSVTTLHDEISFWIDDIERGKIKGEVTIDSGADVCEWSYEFSTHEYIVDCYGAISECDIDFNLIKTFKVCPYCTKPITVKGE